MNIKKWILIGIAAGIFAAFFPAGLFVFTLFLLSIYIIWAYAKDESRDFLIKLFVIGFSLRIFLSFINYDMGLVNYKMTADTQPDAIIYNGNAFYIAHVLKGGDYSGGFKKAVAQDPFLKHSIEKGYDNFNGRLPAMSEYQYGPYVTMLGIFYAWLGYAPIAAKILNGLWACWGAVLIYYIARMLTRTEATARISSALTIFFPSILYWSVTLLQDSLVNLIFLLYVIALLIYLSHSKKSYLVIVVISAVLLGLFKAKIAPILWVGMAMIVIINFLKKMMRMKVLTRSVVLVIVLILLTTLIFLNYSLIWKVTDHYLTSIFNYHKASVISDESSSSFKIYKDFVYNNQEMASMRGLLDFSIIFSILKALGYYFFAPFPWVVPYSHFFLLAFYPLTAFAFISIPFVLIGLLNCIRRAPGITLALLLLLAIFIIPQAMAEGIIGNVVRHRDMFTPFWLIFFAHGFYLTIVNKRPQKGNIVK